MATKNTKPAAPAQRRTITQPPVAPKPVPPAPKPGVVSQSPQTADGKLDATAATNPAVSIDPRATDDKNALDNSAGRVVAAPPTPTNESATTALDHPGEGGLQPGEANPADPSAAKAPAQRRKITDKVSVTVPRAFTLTDDNGQQYRYEQGVQDMERSHAEHHYAEAYGVEINE